ncbi:hypothetical protein ACS0PU_000683 [Formica fusca]
MSDLSTIVVDLDCDRRRILDKVESQEEHIQDLRCELSLLRSRMSGERFAEELQINQETHEELLDDRKGLCTIPIKIDVDPIRNLATSEAPWSEEDLSLLDLPNDPDESPKLDQNMTTLAISLDLIDDMLDKGFESLVRAGRARRRGEAGRPRGRTHRIINRNQMTMNMDRNMEKKLLPQGNRTPSDRRASLTFPEACPSLSHEGLSPLLPTGGEENLATLGTHSESDRDPLDLTFVGCSTSVELDDPENPNRVDAGIEAPVLRDAKANVKRKAKTSPEINSFSDGEGGHGGETPNRSTISLRKLKSRKKRPHTRAAGRSPSLEVPPAEKMSTESEKGTDSDSNKARKTHKKSWF